VSFLVASIGLLVLTLLASYIPARRVARIDPIRALGDESPAALGGTTHRSS
jgi:ABC-type antimicrobial peptide transport system permease subunit